MEALLLDLDDTLLDERGAVQQAYAAFIDAHRHRFGALTEQTLYASWRTIATRHWSRFERGEISFQDQRRHRVRDFLGQPFTDAEADEAFASYLFAYRAAWQVYREVPEFLARTAHLPRIIVTNGERGLQFDKLQITGLADHLAAMITPGDCGAWKPDPGIFMAAAARLGVEAGQCIMIGDDEIRDIQPAAKLGMKTFRVDAYEPERTLLKALEYLGL